MTIDYKPHPDVVFRRLEDRMVLVHMGTNQVFELNSTGARIWELLEEGVEGDELLAALTEEFDVDGDQLRGEVDTILGELFFEGLVTPA
jgi:hypothetical protein